MALRAGVKERQTGNLQRPPSPHKKNLFAAGRSRLKPPRVCSPLAFRLFAGVCPGADHTRVERRPPVKAAPCPLLFSSRAYAPPRLSQSLLAPVYGVDCPPVGRYLYRDNQKLALFTKKNNRRPAVRIGF